MKLHQKLKWGNYEYHGFSCEVTIISFFCTCAKKCWRQFLSKTLALDRPNFNVTKPSGP
jgi:hypothetical protein